MLKHYSQWLDGSVSPREGAEEEISSSLCENRQDSGLLFFAGTGRPCELPGTPGPTELLFTSSKSTGQGLPWVSGKNSRLPVQGTWVPSLLREPDPTHCNQEFAGHNQRS